MNTEQTFNHLNETIKDNLYCSLLDLGLTPGEAYDQVFNVDLTTIVEDAFSVSLDSDSI